MNITIEEFVSYAIIVAIVFGIAILTAMTLLRPKLDYIVSRPFMFALEVLVVAVCPAIPLFFFMLSRGLPFLTASIWFYGLAAKFGLFHILFETSGYYAYMGIK